MSNPIDAMLDQIEWTKIEGVPPSGDAPYATHEGTLHIGLCSIQCYQLSDGRRILQSHDLAHCPAPEEFEADVKARASP